MADPAPEDRMAALRARFAVRLRQEADWLAAALAGVDAWEEIGERSHRLAGIAGSMGYPAISEAAMALDRAPREAGAAEPLARALLAEIEAALA